MEVVKKPIVRIVAEWLIKMRWPIVIVTFVLTAYLGVQSAQIYLAPNLTNMLPQNHPYVKTHNAIRDEFGGVNSFVIEVAVQEGDIFTHETLTKIKAITDTLLVETGVNRYKVISITARKAKQIRAGAWGMEILPVIYGEIPETDSSKEMAELKQAVFSNDQYYRTLVSPDGKSAVILGEYGEWVTFFPEIQKRFEEFRLLYSDDNLSINIYGLPYLLGLIVEILPQMFGIFAVTLAIIFALFFLFFRSLRGTLAPILASLTSIVWALGFAGLLGINLDPMTIVVPFLILAIGSSHCAQKTKRFYEEFAARKDAKEAATETITWLLLPAFTAILTDIAAFGSLYFIPIRMIQDMAIVSMLGVSSIFFTDLALVPILFSLLPPPVGIVERHTRKGVLGESVLRLGKVSLGPGRWVLLAGAAVIMIAAMVVGRRITVGDIHPGTPIFWEESRYNRDVAHISERFLGADPLYVVVEGEGKNAVLQPEVLKNMERFQRYINTDPGVGGSQSLVDILKRINEKIHEDDPKWGFIPDTAEETMNLMYMWWSGADPGDLDTFMTYDNRKANITVFCKDHKGETIRRVIARAKEFIVANPMDGARYRLAGGVVGVLAAVNEVLVEHQQRSVLWMLGFVFLCSALTFRSLLVGLFVMLPLGVGTFLMFAFMYLTDIDLNVNSIPIAALGIGVGVDYTLYIVSRLLDEYKERGSLVAAFEETLPSTGKTVAFTAGTFIAGCITWYFSAMKFQAMMGILLAFLFFVCMVTTITVAPGLVVVATRRRRVTVQPPMG